MKKRAAVSAALLCAVLLTGCVSRSSYDALAQEREALQTQVEKLASELENAKDDIAELQSYTKELVEENNGLRDELVEAKKQVAEQQQRIDAFVKTVEELQEQTRSALPSLPPLPSVPSLPSGEGVQGALDTFSDLLEMATWPLNLR